MLTFALLSSKMLSAVLLLSFISFWAVLSCDTSFLENATVWYSFRDTYLKGNKTKGVTGINKAFNIIIADDNLPDLCSDSIKNFPNLRELRIVNSSVSELEPGAFSGLRNDARLMIYENKLKTIKKGVFNGLEIATVDLHSNLISHIDTEAFDDMPNLKTIKLSKNNLRLWDPNWFKNSPYIGFLDFSFNFIEEIPRESLKNIQMGASTTSSISLYLNDNKINSIHSDAFRGTKRFNSFRFDNNQLRAINKEVFGEIELAHELNLQKNLITCVEDEVLVSMNNISFIELSDNPLSAECKSKLLQYDKKGHDIFFDYLCE